LWAIIEPAKPIMSQVDRPLGKFRPNPKLKLREQLAEVA
jgi:hypothetical protein